MPVDETGIREWRLLNESIGDVLHEGWGRDRAALLRELLAL